MDTPATRKTALAFPVVGQIRKGANKIKKTKPDGKVYEVVGPDLGEYMRVHFHAGNNGADAQFQSSYASLAGGAIESLGNGDYKVKVIRAALTFRHIDDCWTCYNEAYQAGRLIAQADDSKFLRFIDPATGHQLIRDGLVLDEAGKPTGEIRPFVPGEVISYTRGERRYTLKMKPYGRLRLWLPCFERLVTIELRTTSFYDKINIEGQLAAVQGIADALNGGNVAGIPLLIYRKIGDVLRPNEDGSWARDQKWLINVEVDPEWVKVAMAKLRQQAFGSGSLVAMLPSANPEPITVNTPLQAEDGDEENDLVVDAAFEPEKQQHPPIDPPAKSVEHAPAGTTNPEIMTLEFALTLKLPSGKRINELNAGQIADELSQMDEMVRHTGRDNKIRRKALNIVLDHLMKKENS